MVLQQLYDAVVHDGLRKHLQLKQLSDELDVAEGTAAGLVLRFLQLFFQPLPNFLLQGNISVRLEHGVYPVSEKSTPRLGGYNQTSS